MSANSYKQILKSTGIVGGAQVLNIVIGIFRTKIIALLLGPEGIGFLGIFQSIVDMIRNATSFGINFSGVKDIAETMDSHKEEEISKIIYVVRRWALFTGFLGLFVGIAFCIPLSKYAFGSNSYATDIVWVSFSILFTSISAGQIALLQGLRRIVQMAKATLYGSILGTILTLPLYYFYGRNGIVPGIIVVSLGSILISWLYTKNIPLKKVTLKISEIFFAGLGMAKTGLFIIISGFGVAVTMYAMRAMIVDKTDEIAGNIEIGLASVGMFQAVWTISRSYTGTLTNAMLADYFPRLSAVNRDNKAANQLINEQIEMTLLVGVPLILSMIIFAPLVINLLYSSSFDQAISLLQWQMAGTYFTLLSWPLGVLFLAKGKGQFCIMNDLSWCILYYLFVFYTWEKLGFISLGVIFPLAGLINVIMVITEVKLLSGFIFSVNNKNLIAFTFPVVVFALVNVLLFSGWIKWGINSFLLLFTMIVCYRKLNNLIDITHWIKKIRS